MQVPTQSSIIRFSMDTLLATPYGDLIMNEDNSILLQKHKDFLTLRDLSDGTVASYASCMTTFIEWFETNFPQRTIPSITWDEVRAYVRFLKENKKLAPRTINVHVAQLKDFFHYVLHKEWDKYEVPFVVVDEHLPSVPTKEEVNRIIDSTSNLKHKAMLVLLYSAGIRVSELCRLHCGDIISSRKHIYVSRSKNRSDRYAVLSKKALHVLVLYVREFLKGATPEDWLFPGQKPSSHVSTETVRCVFNSQLHALGMDDKGYTLHSLRHAFGLHLYEAGADLMSIKEAMGHKSLSSTTIYLTLGIGNGRSVTSPYDL